MNKKILIILTASILTLALLIFFAATGWDYFTHRYEEKEVSTPPTEEPPATTTPSPYQDSPFGIHEVRFYDSEEVEAVKDLGIKNTRNAPYNNIIWPKIEKERGKYNWSYSDDTITTAYNLGIKTVITVGPGGDGREPGPAKLPDNDTLNWFLEFLGKAVERYDGDGVDDAPGSPKIDVIMIGNEVDGPGFWKDTPENYALFLKKSYQTVKKSSPNMKVSIAGAATPEGFYRFYIPILEELNRIKDNPNDQYFDVFDFHWSGQFKGKYSEIILPDSNKKIVSYDMKQFVKDVKSELDKIGYKNVDIYITEMSDYSGTPASNPTTPGVTYETHSEKEHASSLIKRYIYSLVAGVDKIYWCQIVEQHGYGGVVNGYFDNVALINNPRNPDGLSHKKLAYYTYKKMVEVLEGSDWNDIQTIQESDGIYIYKLTKNNKPIWVAWNDNSTEKQITISGINSVQVKITEAIPKYESGKDVTDYSIAFETETKTISGGKLTTTLSDVPVFVEEK